MPARRRPLTVDDPRHGTPAGHKAHQREGSAPCVACTDARNVYRGGWRETRRLLGRDAS